MRLKACVFALAAVVASQSWAHGPQIQTTVENGKIVTRRILRDGPYSNSLTPKTSVYVIPLNRQGGVWLTQPNTTQLPGGISEFPSGPGLAYGYGYDAATNPAPFPVGSQFELGFTDGLKVYNGSGYVDAGATELEAFRGSGVNAVVARTSDAGPFASIKFPSVISPATGISFAGDGGEVHTGVSYRMLGDGVSPTSSLPLGIFLVSLQLKSTDPAIAPSDPFYFVLSRNTVGSMEAVLATIPLGVSPGATQFIPEPTSVGLLVAGVLGLASLRRRVVAGG